MPKIFTSKTQKIGEIGENLAVRFLVKQGFSILERNYTQKWGEIDIIAKKNSKIHFIEVKSVSRLNLDSVTHETEDDHRPEDNMHPWKLQRLSRTLQTYLSSHTEYEDENWQVDLLIVFLNTIDKKAKIKVVKDIIL